MSRNRSDRDANGVRIDVQPAGPDDEATANGAVAAKKLTPLERFIKYRGKRLVRAKKAMEAIAQFSNRSSYEMSDAARDVILAGLKSAYEECVSRLNRTKKSTVEVDPFAGL